MFDYFYFKDENFSKVTRELVEVNKKLESVQKNIAAVIARELQPHLRSNRIQATPVLLSNSDTSTLSDSSAADETMVPNVQVSNDTSSHDVSNDTFELQVERQDVPVNDPDVIPTSDDITVGEEEVDLLSVSEVTQVYVKSCSRGNMATKLVRRLFDETTRMTSNVKGRGKNRLDPDTIAYVKRKCFEFFPATEPSKVKEDWAKCVIAIDESCRRLNNKPRKKADLSVC